MLQKLAIFVVCIASVFETRQLLCSSDYMTAWYTYEGELMDFSVSFSPCELGSSEYFVTYSAILARSVRSYGGFFSVWSNNVKLFEIKHSIVPCEYFRVCQLIKGESIHDTFPLYTKPYKPPPGVYLVILKMFAPEDFLQMNITVEIKR